MATWNTTRLMGASGNRTARIVTCAKGYGFHSADILNQPANVPRLASTADNSGLRGTWSSDQRRAEGVKGIFFVEEDSAGSGLLGNINRNPRQRSEDKCGEHPSSMREPSGRRHSPRSLHTRGRRLGNSFKDLGKGGRTARTQHTKGDRKYGDHRRACGQPGSMSRGMPGAWDLPGVEVAAAAAEQQRTRVVPSTAADSHLTGLGKSERSKSFRVMRQVQPEKLGSGTGIGYRAYDFRKRGHRHVHVENTLHRRQSATGNRNVSTSHQSGPARGQRQGRAGKCAERGRKRSRQGGRSVGLHVSRSMDSASSSRRAPLSFQQQRWQRAMADYCSLDLKMRTFQNIEQLLESGTSDAPPDNVYRVLHSPTNSKANKSLDLPQRGQSISSFSHRKAVNVPRVNKDNPWWIGDDDDDDVNESLHMYETEYARFLSDDCTHFVGSIASMHALDVDLSERRPADQLEPGDTLTHELDALLDVVEVNMLASADQSQLSAEQWPVDASDPLQPNQFTLSNNGNTSQGQVLSEPKISGWPLHPDQAACFPDDYVDVSVYGRIPLNSFSPIVHAVSRPAWSLVGVRVHVEEPPQVPKMQQHADCTDEFVDESILHLLSQTEHKLAMTTD